MDVKTIIENYWQAALAQDAAAMRAYFCKDAYINWHNTNEHFTVDEFIRANCEYPDSWAGDMERYHVIDDVIITVMHVYPTNHTSSFHVTSFIGIKEGKIASIDEYWGDDGEAPKWRRDLHIGKQIKDL